MKLCTNQWTIAKCRHYLYWEFVTSVSHSESPLYLGLSQGTERKTKYWRDISKDNIWVSKYPKPSKSCPKLLFWQHILIGAFFSHQLKFCKKKKKSLYKIESFIYWIIPKVLSAMLWHVAIILETFSWNEKLVGKKLTHFSHTHCRCVWKCPDHGLARWIHVWAIINYMHAQCISKFKNCVESKQAYCDNQMAHLRWRGSSMESKVNILFSSGIKQNFSFIKKIYTNRHLQLLN